MKPHASFPNSSFLLLPSYFLLSNNATFPIGSIVVQMVAKSLLILIKRGDMQMELRVQRSGSCRSKVTRVGASERGQQTSFNGATGMSDIEGKAARVAASECGQRASFKSLLILIRSGDMCRKCALWFYTSGGSSASRSWPSLNLRSDE